MTHPTHREQRSGTDRRSVPTTVWDAIFCGGHRQLVRREFDQQQPYFVDRFSALTFTWILLLLVFTVADGLLTLELIEAGYDEINPVMLYFLRHGPMSFLLGKYFLAAAGLPVLVLFGSRSRFRHALPCFVSLYAILLTYQLLQLNNLN